MANYVGVHYECTMTPKLRFRFTVKATMEAERRQLFFVVEKGQLCYWFYVKIMVGPLTERIRRRTWEMASVDLSYN